MEYTSGKVIRLAKFLDFGVMRIRVKLKEGSKKLFLEEIMDDIKIGSVINVSYFPQSEESGLLKDCHKILSYNLID